MVSVLSRRWRMRKTGRFGRVRSVPRGTSQSKEENATFENVPRLQSSPALELIGVGGKAGQSGGKWRGSKGVFDRTVEENFELVDSLIGDNFHVDLDLVTVVVVLVYRIINLNSRIGDWSRSWCGSCRRRGSGGG